MTYILPQTPTSILQMNQWVSPPQIPGIIPTPVVAPHTTIQTLPQSAVTLGSAFKPKRAGTKTSHIIFILDDSGSMQSCRDNTIAGFNEYLAGQKTDAENTKIETFVSLYKFDGSSVKCTIDHVNIKDVTPLDRNSYNPQGGTNLLDALGGVLMKINERLSSVKKADRESIVVTVLTDGEENSSRTFRNEDIKVMVEKAEGKNWGFMFLGANINAFHTSSALGFNVNNTVQFNNNSAANAIRTASEVTSRMKSGYSQGFTTLQLYDTSGFNQNERAMAVTKDDE
jgi:uncharacterized protein YegL